MSVNCTVKLCTPDHSRVHQLQQIAHRFSKVKTSSMKRSVKFPNGKRDGTSVYPWDHNLCPKAYYYYVELFCTGVCVYSPESECDITNLHMELFYDISHCFFRCYDGFRVEETARISVCRRQKSIFTASVDFSPPTTGTWSIWSNRDCVLFPYCIWKWWRWKPAPFARIECVNASRGDGCRLSQIN